MSIEKVREHFKKWNLEKQIRELPQSSATVELAAKALSVEPARIAKTLSFKDGDNANTDATSYKRELITISDSRQLSIEMKNGGGFAARIYKK